MSQEIKHLGLCSNESGNQIVVDQISENCITKKAKLAKIYKFVKDGNEKY